MAFWDGLLNWLGYGHEEDAPVTDNLVKEPELRPTPPNTGKAKLVSLPTARQTLRLVIARPQSFDQAANLAENLKNYRPVIVNVEALPVDEARRIIDFLSGATYALGGRVRRVTSGIFLFTSSNIDLSGDLEDQVAGGINWLEAAGRK
ncbi:cell division protein SepF [Neomoorella mulderi]|uniref:Cell division protein SepF n=1 Tax=Moorella mulderi DSM 14980 TaxID=1122241 RepID=A0A151AY59_9FIRM|nr:cell division protein SepF [Moorella mulderi]KYH32576.1 cell division protein SepF [Moorella mulderi DSM 14980]